MDYYVLVWSVCLFVEERVRSEIDLAELSRQTGFSLAHIRDVFRRLTGRPLSRYIHERKIANAAEDLLDSDYDVMEIALRYGYSSRDVFARAFRRYTGYTPSGFRAARPATDRVRLCAGVFGPALPRKNAEED